MECMRHPLPEAEQAGGAYLYKAVTGDCTKPETQAPL
jgi:hypothetical protein